MSPQELNLTRSTTAHLFSTVRLSLLDKHGEETGSATSFFFRDSKREGRPSYLVTNKHVVEGQHAMRARFHLDTNQQRHKFSSEISDWIEISDPAEKWTSHPDSEVDLCALRVADLKDLADGQLDELFFAAMDSHGISDPSDEANFPAILEIAMIGYPTGLWDEVNNLPIIRRGTTASHPAVDFAGKPVVVIDMACFPGSSGSPVVFADRPYFGSTHRFLGVLCSGPVHSAEGEIRIRDIPTRNRVVAVSPQMVHLGFVVKASEVLRLVRHLEANA